VEKIASTEPVERIANTEPLEWGTPRNTGRGVSAPSHVNAPPTTVDDSPVCSAPPWDWGNIYSVGRTITSGLAFIICWIYATFTYGLFLGIGLGWIPSLVIAFIAGLLWPLIVAAFALLAVFVLYAATH